MFQCYPAIKSVFCPALIFHSNSLVHNQATFPSAWDIQLFVFSPDEYKFRNLVIKQAPLEATSNIENI